MYERVWIIRRSNRIRVRGKTSILVSSFIIPASIHIVFLVGGPNFALHELISCVCVVGSSKAVTATRRPRRLLILDSGTTSIKRSTSHLRACSAMTPRSSVLEVDGATEELWRLWWIEWSCVTPSHSDMDNCGNRLMNSSRCSAGVETPGMDSVAGRYFLKVLSCCWSWGYQGLAAN